MNKKVSLLSTVLLCLLTGIVAFMSAWTVTREDYKNKLNDMYLKYPEAVKLMEIIRLYDELYPGDADKAFSEDLALKGFITGTGDRYGYYYTKEEYEENVAQNNGNTVGIGITIEYRDDGLKILRVSKDSPASKAGMMPGDMIIGVGELDISAGSKALADAIRGEIGTKVDIKLQRDGKIINVSTERQVYTTDSVIGVYLEKDKTGFIRILGFDNTTPGQFKEALEEMKDKGAERFIFDLRGNGGGLLSSLGGVLENLLPKDTLYATARMKNGNKKEYKTGDNGAEFDYPTAVLINGETASAAELFTAVMRDYEKCVTVGERSFGKGVMQTTYTLSDGSAVKLTSAYYDPPSGENYDGKGITPQVNAAMNEGQYINYYGADEDDPVIKAAIEELKKQ